ncbi:MAG: hypothetical protein IM500_12900, partial [Microcystis sp. M179S2]|nr:hypothetical protein [Microcystis sp. M179S2]
ITLTAITLTTITFTITLTAITLTTITFTITLTAITLTTITPHPTPHTLPPRKTFCRKP